MEIKKPGKLYKTLSTISTVGLFITVGLLVTGLLQGYLSPITALILSIFTIIFAGCMLSLVWINNIENKRYTKTSIVFLAFTVLCCLLWIAAAIMVYVILVKSASNKSYNPTALLRFIKIAGIISIQFVVSNIITRNLIKYKKTYIAFQIIMYISCLFVDFYVSMFALGIQFTPEKGMAISKTIGSFLFSGGMITTFILFVVYIAIANSVLNGIQTKKNGGQSNRRRRTLIGSLVDEIENGSFEEVSVENKPSNETKVVEQEEKKEKESPQERLTKLKQLFEDGLITEEEFNAKKQEILEEM